MVYLRVHLITCAKSSFTERYLCQGGLDSLLSCMFSFWLRQIFHACVV